MSSLSTVSPLIIPMTPVRFFIMGTTDATMFDIADMVFEDPAKSIPSSSFLTGSAIPSLTNAAISLK